jgi:predicted short-subunit dehydrogenase-like oxidoreductase (DUF2520 family)
MTGTAAASGGADGADGADRVGPTIGIIGAGRAGSAIGTALARSGHDVVAVHTRTAAGAARAAARFPRAVAGTPADVAAAADVVLVAVPDDAIAGVAADLAAAGAVRAGQTVAHLSGRHGLAVLGPVSRSGAGRAAMHPIMTLAGAADDASRLAGTPFGVTADPSAWPVVTRLVSAVGGRLVPVADDMRTSYHAALALSGNYLITLVSAAADLLRGAGVADPAAALGPLLRASLDNALAHGDAAMTGPVRRGDAGSVGAHLVAVRAVDQSLAAAYAALAVLTADRLERAGLVAPSALAAVRDAVASHPAPVPPPARACAEEGVRGALVRGTPPGADRTTDGAKRGHRPGGGRGATGSGPGVD